LGIPAVVLEVKQTIGRYQVETKAGLQKAVMTLGVCPKEGEGLECFYMLLCKNGDHWDMPG